MAPVLAMLREACLPFNAMGSRGRHCNFVGVWLTDAEARELDRIVAIFRMSRSEVIRFALMHGDGWLESLLEETHGIQRQG